MPSAYAQHAAAPSPPLGRSAVVAVAHLVRRVERGRALLDLEIVGRRLLGDIEREEARLLDARQDKLVLVPHGRVGHLQVERELAHVLQRPRVDQVAQPLPLKVAANLHSQHVDLGVAEALHDGAQREHGVRDVGPARVVRGGHAVIGGEADRHEVLRLAQLARAAAAERVERDDRATVDRHRLVKVPDVVDAERVDDGQPLLREERVAEGRRNARRCRARHHRPVARRAAARRRREQPHDRCHAPLAAHVVEAAGSGRRAALATALASPPAGCWRAGEQHKRQHHQRVFSLSRHF
mmetsp:Transcript_67594/g.179821  ORF Transcript_67594/g.179821 Transcript_67594/m.179821 type:complete len:296 (+) Transcript_67594:241-1128(+)